MCSCHSIPECCVMFSGVKLSIGSFVLLLCKTSKNNILNLSVAFSGKTVQNVILNILGKYLKNRLVDFNDFVSFCRGFEQHFR